MNKEIRIYYESYEQANHYIKPIIQNEFANMNIKLIYLSRGIGFNKGSLVSCILRFKNPDIMITLVNNDEEIPLFVIEFSEAVMTEDHELQRFDGYLGAVAGQCFYIKISPFKSSQNEHGGNTEFDVLEPYALIYKRFGIPAFHFEWPLETSTFVKRDSIYLSCPPPIESLNKLITETIWFVLIEYDRIRNKGLFGISHKLKNIKTRKWIQRLGSVSFEDNSSKLNSTRLKWLAKEKSLLFKFNRMGHAMDPERGMIWYYRYRYNYPMISRIIFPSTGDGVFDKIELKKDYDYLKAFMVGTGLDKDKKFTEFLLRKKYLVSHNLISNKINISEFLSENFENLNKQLVAIFSNSVQLLIQDSDENNRIILNWDNEFSPLNKKTNTKTTSIKERISLEEDDITYIVAHQVLKKNGFKILSLSYPGAQGDRAILPKRGTGRRQIRKYLDIIACCPNKYIDITENKGEYQLKKITEDIQKLNLFKSKSNYSEALYKLVETISPGNKGLPILLSVSFWVPNKQTNLKGLPIEKIHFFVTISPNMKKWKIWTGGNLNIFKYKEGNVILPKTYCVK